MPAPYSVNVEGCFHDVSEVYESRQGTRMVDFKLSDSQGDYIFGVAHGPTSGNLFIENNRTAWLFFCKMQPGVNGEPSKLWLYGDAIIIPKSNGIAMRPLRNAITVA